MCMLPLRPALSHPGKKLEAVENQVSTSSRLGRFMAAGGKKGEQLLVTRGRGRERGRQVETCSLQHTHTHTRSNWTMWRMGFDRVMFCSAPFSAHEGGKLERGWCATRCLLLLTGCYSCPPLPVGEDGKLEGVVRDTARVAAEQIKGLSTQVRVGWVGCWCLMPAVCCC